MQNAYVSLSAATPRPPTTYLMTTGPALSWRLRVAKTTCRQALSWRLPVARMGPKPMNLAAWGLGWGLGPWAQPSPAQPSPAQAASGPRGPTGAPWAELQHRCQEFHSEGAELQHRCQEWGGRRRRHDRSHRFQRVCRPMCRIAAPLPGVPQRRCRIAAPLPGVGGTPTPA